MNRTERQKLGLKRWFQSGMNGTIVWVTGIGKTYSSMMLINTLLNKDPSLSVLISVPTEVLKRQWLEYLIKYNFLSNCKVEIINTIVKTTWEVDLLIIDEIHLAASKINSTIFTVVNYKMILGLTGTLERLDGKETIILEYAPVCDRIEIEEAIKNEWLSPYKEYKVLLDVDLSEYNELTQKFNGYFSYFAFNFSTAMSCATNIIYRRKYAKKLGLDHKIVTAMAMDWLRCMQKRKKFVMSHPKKLEIIHKILEKRLDKKCITFSATIKDAEQIKYGNTIHSGKTKKKNRITIEEFELMTSGILNSNKSLDQGVDLKGLSVSIIASGNSSSITKKQRLGRTIRYEKDKIAEVFVLIIKDTIEESWFNNATTSNYITINEKQLDSVLNGENIQSRQRNNIQNIKYRF